MELVGAEEEDWGHLGRKYLGEAGPPPCRHIHIIGASFSSLLGRPLAASARTAMARGAWTSEEQDTPLSMDLFFFFD